MGSEAGFRIFVENGRKWVFAGAVDWPGWCRRGKDEAQALQALLMAGPRYAQAIPKEALGFIIPGEAAVFQVIQRVEGNSTTDFGAPDAALVSDLDPIEAHERARFHAILQGCWAAFDQAVELAQGKELQRGPRGGGRNLAKIIDHLLEGDASYLSRIGWKAPHDKGAQPRERLESMRLAVLEGLLASARGELPNEGPRGGLLWPARRFVRRVAWHTLDHAWEIEDRLE